MVRKLPGTSSETIPQELLLNLGQRNKSDELSTKKLNDLTKSNNCTSRTNFRPKKSIHIHKHSHHPVTHLIFSLFIILTIKFINQCAIAENTSDSIDRIENQFTCQAIEPKILENESQLKPMQYSICPLNTTLIIYSSDGDEFVIDLVKNSRLTSEKKSKLFDKPSKYQLGKQKNSYIDLRNDSTPNHIYIPMHNFKNIADHCHYLGIVNNNNHFISAMSIVDYKLLSGFFHDEKYSYHLIANSTMATTFLIKTKTGAMFPSNAAIEKVCSFMKPTNLGRNNHIRHRRAALGKEADSLIRSAATQTTTSIKRRKKSSPDNKVLHEPYQRNSSSLFVELLVVHDHNQFKDYNGNATLIAERTMQIVNIMNAFYRQLNIFIALVGVVLWTTEDEIKLTEDGDATLTNFLQYRHEKLLPRYHHDNAQLITSTSFNGSVVGKALKGPICTHYHSGGVNTDHSHSPAVVAVTLAHELGHNLGMEHDEDNKCTCPDEKCIMSSSSSFVHPKHWSSCSLEYLEDSKKHGLLDCLVNEPDQVFGPICGNGFVEEGEDCDIGEPIPSYGTSKSRHKMEGNDLRWGTDFSLSSWMANPCCDRATCKFVANATCAQGPCCDLTRCSVFNNTETRVCRPKKSECDFEETCDGQSEYCPPDAHYHDGIECGPAAVATGSLVPSEDRGSDAFLAYNRSRSYCYKGFCASHETQCRLLWGSSGSTSRDICYEQNIHGNTSGNCGYNRNEKTYESCQLEDTLCGMLHCVHSQLNSGDSLRKTGKLGYGFESASILTKSFFVMSNNDRIYCHGAIIDSGPYTQDPGLVPNGAACGEDRMCLNQKCIPVAEIIYKNWCPSDCNGNGVCDNEGVCHCHDGTVGTSCYQFFGSNFHLSLLLYIVMFFGPIVVLVVLAANHYRKQLKMWWYLHNRKIALKNKSSSRPGHHNNQQTVQDRRAMAYQAKDNLVRISEPIPLNHHQAAAAASKAGSTFQSQNSTGSAGSATNGGIVDEDPWAETSTSVAASRPSDNLISALTTPVHTSATEAAFGLSRSLGFRLEPLPSKPLQPLPPPVPPHQNLRQSSAVGGESSHTVQDQASQGQSNPRPVRSAPPPPIPAHTNRR